MALQNLQTPAAGTQLGPLPSDAVKEPGGVRTKPQFSIHAQLFLAVFAFLLASFPARNSDLWVHLAAGRDIVQLHHGSTDGSVAGGWFENFQQGWLYDVICFGIYSAAGGIGLVVSKAILAGVLALVLMRCSRIGHGVWVPAVCTALAILAISMRIPIQPSTVSYFLLAMTFLLLLRDVDAGPAGEQTKAYRPTLSWQLPVLFCIWANLDVWFVLGLAFVALVWIGEALDGPGAVSGRMRLLGTRLISFGMLAVACLLNPMHIHALRIPNELSFLLAVEPDPSISSTARNATPFQEAYLLGNLGMTPAGLAYFPLLGLSAFSFLFVLPRWHWRRLLPWMAVAILSGFEARLIPFFAVVTGPILAWNLQDFFARHSEEERREGAHWTRALWAMRTLTVVLGLVFLGAAWPGWLQAPPYEPRRWEAEPPSSLVQGTAEIRRWLHEGRIGARSKGLHLTSASAATFAWFCPEYPGVIDDSLASKILGLESGEQSAGKNRNSARAVIDSDWENGMRSSQISHVVLYDPDRNRLGAALDRFLNDARQWPLLLLEGDLAVFGWRDPVAVSAPDPFAGWELDLEKRAFQTSGSTPSSIASDLESAERREWWEVFWKPAPPRLIERDEASLYLVMAEAMRRSAPLRHLAAWESSQAAAIVGAASGWTTPAAISDAVFRRVLLQPPLPESGATTPALPVSQLAIAWQVQFTRGRDDTPPAILYLGLRSARRAVTANPGDAAAHLVLGDTYLRLLHDTRERSWEERLPELISLRRVQASTALNRAIQLRPNLAQAHFKLGWLYREIGCLDLALAHLNTHRRLVLETDGTSSSSEQAGLHGPQYAEALNQLTRLVEEGERTFQMETARMRLIDRVSVALQKGLGGRALNTLLETDIAMFGQDGMALELELLLSTGRAKDVREWTTPEQLTALGASKYHSLRTRAAGALGDYTAAMTELEFITGTKEESVKLHRFMLQLVSQGILDQNPAPGAFPFLVWQTLPKAEFRRLLGGMARTYRQRADVTVLRGLIALEQGDLDLARDFFSQALQTWKDEATAASGGGIEFSSRSIAQQCLRWLNGGG